MRVRVLLSLLVLALVAVPAVWAQRGTVRGTIRHAETAEPLAAVNVTLERDGAIVAGAVTDAEGRYRIGGVRHGRYVLAARFTGFGTVEQPILLESAEIVLDLALAPAVLDLDEVQVEADEFQDRADPNVSVTRLAPGEARALPGAGEDVLRTLQARPGVQAASDFSNQLIVRGGTPDQNLILLDDIEVYSPYQLSGIGSLLNPALVRQVELFAGAFPAAYGDRLSSVLAVRLRDGRADTWLGGELSTNLTTANLILEGKTGFMRGSWLVSGRRTYFDSFANTFAQRVGVFNEIAFPDFEDVQGRLTLRPAAGHLVRLTGLFSRDRLALLAEKDAFGEQEGADNLLDGDNETRNAALGVAWSYAPSGEAQLKLLANWYRNAGESAMRGLLTPALGARNPSEIMEPPPLFSGRIDTARFAFDQAYGLEKATVAAQAALRRGRHVGEAGAGLDVLENALDLDLALDDYGRFVFDAFRATNQSLAALTDSLDEARRYRRYHAYVQDRIALGAGRVFLQPSLRYDYYGLLGRGFVSPRLSASVLMGEALTLRLAGGRYVQSPGFEKLLDPNNLFNLARYEALDELSVEEAWHLGASLSQRLGAAWLVKLDGYWKRLDGLIIPASERVVRPVPHYQPGAAQTNYRVGRLDAEAYRILEQTVLELTNTPINGAEGRAYGAEVLAERRPAGGAWHGWIAYAWARATRTLATGETVPFEYDRRHTFSAFVQRRLGRHLDVAATWRYGSGFPFTPAVEMTPLVAVVDDEGMARGVVLSDPETGHVRLLPGYGGAANVNAGRLPPYHRLDFRATAHAGFGGVGLDLYLDLINVYNRRNTVTYKYYVDVTAAPEGSRLPGALRKPADATLYREPIYMFPFVPSLGFRLRF